MSTSKLPYSDSGTGGAPRVVGGPDAPVGPPESKIRISEGDALEAWLGVAGRRRRYATLTGAFWRVGDHTYLDGAYWCVLSLGVGPVAYNEDGFPGWTWTALVEETSFGR